MCVLTNLCVGVVSSWTACPWTAAECIHTKKVDLLCVPAYRKTQSYDYSKIEVF